METFLNERSLHAQFKSVMEFADALRTLNTVMARVVGAPVAKRLYFDASLYQRQTVGDVIFSSCLERLPDKSVRFEFKILLRDKLDAAQWRPDRVHDDSAYVCHGENVVETSLAEHAERRLLGRTGFLISFGASAFPQDVAVLVVKGQQSVALDSVQTPAGLLHWYSEHPELGIATYDRTSKEKPRDEQTVLGRRSRFTPTKIRNQGRKIYLDRQAGRYWCVDNEHFGSAAHLEIFDAKGEHVGEANLDGTLIPGSHDPTKGLVL